MTPVLIYDLLFPAERRERWHVPYLLELADHPHNGLRSFFRPLGEGGAVEKLGGNLIVSHRIGRTALPEIGASGNVAAILEPDRQDRQ